jgi:D-xylonolactonase
MRSARPEGIASTSKPELVANTRCAIGEGPLWHPEENRLYWVDIPAGRMFRYDPASGCHEQVLQSGVIGGFTIQADGALLMFMEEGAGKLWSQGKLSTVLAPRRDHRHHRFNDVIADPLGGVLCGVIGYDKPIDVADRNPAELLIVKGRRRLRHLARRFMPRHRSAGGLFHLDRQRKLTRLANGIGLANGMGFSPDWSRLYFADSGKRELLAFDYNSETGGLSNRRLFARVPEGEGVPDGLTVDSEGYVWSARWDGACVVRYDPQGAVERSFQLPARKVSSVTFGGSDYRDLYLTTAGGGDRETEGPGAGALFRLTPGVQGMPEFRSRVES